MDLVLIFGGIAGCVVGLVGLVAGSIPALHLHNRKHSFLLIGASFLVFMAGGAITEPPGQSESRPEAGKFNVDVDRTPAGLKEWVVENEASFLELGDSLEGTAQLATEPSENRKALLSIADSARRLKNALSEDRPPESEAQNFIESVALLEVASREAANCHGFDCNSRYAALLSAIESYTEDFRRLAVQATTATDD